MKNIFSSDAICVKFITPTLIIYGKGNQLQLKSENNEITNEITPYDKIHRISFLKCNDEVVAVACAAGKEILVTKIKNNQFQGGFITKFNDWISSIKILSNGSIAAVTSHNFAILLEHTEDEKLVIKEKLRCDDNSTLYCSHIHGDSWDDLTFFAGTALGELIIWKNIKKSPTTLCQKSIHNGVIFSIDYNHNFLLTSSDDRSIKTFNIDENWKLTELKQFFGHTARVFACKVIKFDSEDNFLFLSAGEDSNLCIWRSDDGKLLAKMNVDASGGIWSVDYDEKNAIVVTSGSKGKLNRFRLRQILLENVCEDFTASICSEPAKIKFLSCGSLCVLDYNMSIFIHNSITNDWKKAAQLDAERQKVIVIEAWENRLFFMTRNSILIFDYQSASDSLQFTSELVIDHEKFSLQFEYFRAMHALNFHQVFISDASGACIVIDLTHQKLMKAFKIPKSAEPWSTSVAFINQYWLIADRMGSLFLYRDETFDGAIYQLPIQKLSKLHAQKMGVKTIRSLGSGFIKTTGNDGTIKTLFLNKEKELLEIYQCQKSAVKWIERVESFNGNEYILGFNDNYFVISKSSGGEIIYEHSCGGRHRHWDLHFSSIKHPDSDDDNNKMRLAYIKRKQVNCVEFFLNDFTFSSPDDFTFSWHTRVCNVVQMIDDDVKVLASGGEDTIIKLFKVDMMNDDASLKKIAEINSHISSVKAMTMWKCDKSKDVWIISAGGRAQIVVTRLIGMTQVKEEVNFMLTNSLTLGNAKQSTFDPETRFMSLHFDHASEFLFVGCSDGYLRAFKLIKNDSSTSLRLMIESYYGKCILQVYAVSKSFVLTMATDGVVCFWHFDDGALSIKLIDKLHHNQNGINSFDVYNNVMKNCYTIATAGDDCGIFITDFEIVASAIKFNKKTIHSYAAHIAQVNGIKFLSRNILITTSIDQTLCKLQLIDDDKIEVVERRFTCVADVKGFAFYDSNKYIFIYGAGLEMIKSF